MKLRPLASAHLPEEREMKWKKLAEAVRRQIDESGLARINFICTHNARRSHMAQVWAQYIALEKKLPVVVYSGGADVTRIHPNTLACLGRFGFETRMVEDGENPKYFLPLEGPAGLTLFSKKFDDPSSEPPFIAVLVCSSGDQACPFIPNAAARILIPFEDPGYADGTSEESEAYDKAFLQIGSELNRFFSLL